MWADRAMASSWTCTTERPLRGRMRKALKFHSHAQVWVVVLCGWWGPIMPSLLAFNSPCTCLTARSHAHAGHYHFCYVYTLQVYSISPRNPRIPTVSPSYTVKIRSSTSRSIEPQIARCIIIHLHVDESWDPLVNYGLRARQLGFTCVVLVMSNQVPGETA